MVVKLYGTTTTTLKICADLTMYKQQKLTHRTPPPPWITAIINKPEINRRDFFKVLLSSFYCAFQSPHADSKIQSSTDDWATNALFAAVNQMFGGSSQLLTTDYASDYATVLSSSRKLGAAAEHLIDDSAGKRIFVG